MRWIINQNPAAAGPAWLAREIVRGQPGAGDEAAQEKLAREIEAEIRELPQLYYPDYRDACERHGIVPLGPGAWADVCIPLMPALRP